MALTLSLLVSNRALNRSNLGMRTMQTFALQLWSGYGHVGLIMSCDYKASSLVKLRLSLSLATTTKKIFFRRHFPILAKEFL